MKRRIKVLHIITGLGTGGAERTMYNLLADGLAKHLESHVVALSNEGTFGQKLREHDVPVSSVGIRGGVPSCRNIMELRRLVRKCDPDIVQGWMYHGNLAARYAISIIPRKSALVWNVRQSFNSLLHEKPTTRHVIRANRLLSGHPDAIIYNSRQARENHEVFGFDGRRGLVIPNGFDLDSLGPSDKTTKAVRCELGIPPHSRVVGHVARYHPMKDHAGFVRSAVRVGKKLKNVHFVLCGTDVVPGNVELVDLIPVEMQVRFHWLGERDDVTDVMCAMDLLCQSSWSEAFPNVLGEAMATGVPCVATNVGDSENILGGTGLIVPPRDDAALAGALVRMLELPGHELAELGAQARRRVEERYSLGSAVQKYSVLYKQLVQNLRDTH